jgi:threonyl-tRNA synthetase
LAKVPALLIVGRNEMENNEVSVRKLGSDKQEVMSVDDCINMIHDMVARKR